MKDHHQRMNQFILLTERHRLENFSVHLTKQLFLQKELTRLSRHVPLFLVGWAICRQPLILILVGVSIVQGFVFNKMELEGVGMLVFIIVSVLLLIIPSIMISRQPQSSAALSFSVSDKIDYGILILLKGTSITVDTFIQCLGQYIFDDCFGSVDLD